MNATSRNIAQIVDNLELISAPCVEYEIDRSIHSYIKRQGREEIPSDWMAEGIAFSFMPNYQHSETGWGTYYGPMMVFRNEKGQPIETPSIRLVTSEILDYWKKRSEETNHPILKLRYADLIWDFSNTVVNKQPHYSVANTIIDSTLEIAKGSFCRHETDVKIKLERALSVAISINDLNRIDLLRDTIIEYEDSIAQDDKPGLWGFSFELLVNNKKVALSAEVENKIIQNLEDRLERLSDINDKDHLDPWAAEMAALNLATYYRSRNQNEDVRRVVLKLGVAFEASSEDAAPLQNSAWLQHLHAIYLDFGLSEEAKELGIKIKDIGPKVKDEMHTFSYEFKITDQEMDNFINAIIVDDLETTLARIAKQFIPSKDYVENQLKDLSQAAPISFLFTQQVQDYQGRPIATIGPLEHDLIGNIVSQTSKNMRTNGKLSNVCFL